MGSTLVADDLDDRTEFVELLNGPRAVDAVDAWTLGLIWFSRSPNTRRGIPVDRLAEVLADAEIAQRLVDVGLWHFTGTAYRPVQCTSNGRRLWTRAPGSGLTASRTHIPADVRDAVYERDGYACRHCGATDDLALDHIHPWSRGGPDTVDNLQVLCRSCNSKKGAKV